jgi:hypothetical protein
MKPTSAATYERDRRLANMSLWAINLQCRRLRSSEPEDDDFVFRKWADFDFLIVALTRFRRAAKLAANISEIQLEVSVALKEFDSALPHLKKMRDVAEHIDDYAIDRGREPSVNRYALEVSSFSDDDDRLVLEWLEHQLNADEALKASQKLFDTIRKVSTAFTKVKA